MNRSDSFQRAFENTFSVLKARNMKELLFSTFRIEKNALLGFAAETIYILLLMLAGLTLGALLVLLKRI